MKKWRIYEIIDIETGEQLNPKNYERKNYVTIKTEKDESIKNGYITKTTRRLVKHNGQQRINL